MTDDFFDGNQLSAEQLSSLNDEQKAIYQILDTKDKQFFANTFSAKDLPGALSRKGEIIKRNKAQYQKLLALQTRFAQVTPVEDNGTGNAGDLGSIVAGAAASVGIGVAAKAVSTDGTASWKGVPPRYVADALETAFDDGNTTDIEVEGNEDDLTATIYLRPADGSRYVPALTISLIFVNESLNVKMGDLTQETWLETARQGGQKLLELAQKGLWLWARRRSIFSPEAMDLAQSAVDSAFDAAQTARDLKIQERAWKIIKDTADEREKAYLIEEQREEQKRRDLEKAWDDYRKCPRCGEVFAEADTLCRICGRGRNSPPSQSDPRKVQ